MSTSTSPATEAATATPSTSATPSDAFPTDAATPARLPLASLLVLAFVVFSSVAAELLPVGLILGMSASLGVSHSAIGTLVSTWALGIVLSTLPLVRLTARLDRRVLLLGSLSVFAASNLWIGLATEYGVVVVARFISAAALDAAGLWRTAFWGVSALLALSIVVLALRVPSVPAAGPLSWGSLRGDRGARRLVPLLGAGGLLLVGNMSLYAYVVPLLVAAGVAEGSVGGVLLLAGAAGAVGVLLSGLLADRWSRQALIGVMGVVLLGAGAFALALAGASAWPAVVGGLLLGLAVGSFPPLLQTRMLQLAPERMRDTAAGLLVVVLNVGIALGAAVGAAALARLGPSALPPAAGLATLLALVWFAAATPRRAGPTSGRVES